MIALDEPESMMPLQYEWAEYRELRRQGRLVLGVTDAAARELVRLPEMRPSDRRVMQAFTLWRTIAFACFAAGIVLAFTWKWWAAVAGVVAWHVIWQATALSLRQELLAAADEDERFYTRAAVAGAWHYTVPTQA